MSLLIEIAVLVVGALLAISQLRRLPSSAAALRRRGARRRPAPVTSADLATVEQLVSIAQSSAADVHLRLRPALRRIAAGKLAAHRIVLDGDPEAARAALGDELWEIVRPGRPAPADSRGPGLSLSRLSGLVTTLEDL
jgi:hypothetical protein